MKRLAIFAVFALVIYGGAALALQDSGPESTLVLYSTVERLLSGDVVDGALIEQVQADLDAYPDDWAVVGVGTTNQAMRNGELMPDGTADDLHFWWADPSSESEAAIVDLSAEQDALELPFLGLAVADPASAVTFTAENVENVHQWLTQTLTDAGIALAGVQLHGEFGEVKTTVAYNIPETGLDLSGGYVGEDVFRFGDYAPATWTMNGLFAADTALQPVIATPGSAVHLHGYQPDTDLGGHITSAAAVNVTATVYPLNNLDLELEPGDGQ